eukprot:gene10983-12811_t
MLLLPSNLRQFQLGTCHVSSSALVELSQNLPHLELLKLNTPNDVVNDADIAALVRHCTRLTSLTLHRFERLTGDVLCGMAVHLPALIDLRLESLQGAPSQITDNGVVAVVKGCPHLQNLVLACCTQLTDTAVQALCTHSKTLCLLNLVNCTGLTDRAFDTLRADSVLRVVLLNGTNLCRAFATLLRVLGDRLQTLSCSNLTDTTVEHFEKHPNRLVIFSVLGCTTLSQPGWLRLSRCFPHLHHLVVTRCPQIDDEVVRSFVEHSTKIGSIVLALCDHVSNELIQEIPFILKS